VGLKLKSVQRICLTSLTHHAVGGMPGFVLTAADAAEIQMEHNLQLQLQKARRQLPQPAMAVEDNTATNSRRKRKYPQPSVVVVVGGGGGVEVEEERRPDLEVLGPVGTKKFLESLRHFVRRDKFQISSHEGRYDTYQQNVAGATNHKKEKKKMCQDIIRVHTIPLHYHCSIHRETAHTYPVCSYIFTTPPIAGKFRPDKAKALGIPPGPLYAKLKSGQAVTYVHTQTHQAEQIAKPEDVLDEGSPGVAVAVLYVPSLEVLKQLQQEEVFEKYSSTSNENNNSSSDHGVLEAMVHITSQDVFESETYQAWLRTFDRATQTVDHLTMFTMQQFSGGGEECDGSPFRSATIKGAMSRACVQSDVFISPFCPVADLKSEERTLSRTNGSGISVIQARPTMEYILIPRKRRGLPNTKHTNFYQHGILPAEKQEVLDGLRECNAVQATKAALEHLPLRTQQSCTLDANKGELIFTGTGSAIPCKHRNVTGKYLRMNNGNALLLDVGEGTTGQLFRCWKYNDGNTTCQGETTEDRFARFNERLVGIKAVWISHPHADHHVGLIRLLAERAHALSAQNKTEDPLVLMAPAPMFRFLAEYEILEPIIRGSYMSVDCSNMRNGKPNPMADRLLQQLGTTSCFSVPVAHCPHSYAVVIDNTAFGRVVYSGDCRPSEQLAQLGVDADLLIHEATFEDGMEEEAVIKRHSTVGEALTIRRKMNAKAIVLTHFSQRYPRIPPLPKNDATSVDIPIIFAFDFMRLKPNNLQTASLITPALRLLYPEEVKDPGPADGGRDDQPSAKELLAIPGAFAVGSHA